MLSHAPQGGGYRPNDHTTETVRDGLIKTMSTLPAHLRGSLTWDQGVEMAKHKALSIATDMDVYFCDPAQPLAARLQREHQAGCCASTSQER